MTRILDPDLDPDFKSVSSVVNLRWRCWRCIRKDDAMYRFPIISWHHLDRVPRATIEKRAVRTLAGALLTADAEIWIDFDSSERRMVFVGHPEHAGFNRTILDTRRRSGATRAAIGGDCEYAGPLLACRLSIALRHGPVLVYNIEHPLLSLTFLCG